jgi:hypothetical protein
VIPASLPLRWLLLHDLLALGLAVGALRLLWSRALPAAVYLAYRASVPHQGFERYDGSEGAGSEDLRYLATTYDCRQHDLLVSGQAPDAPYWGIGIFDGTLRILDGGHRNHRTVRRDEAGRWQVRLTRDPLPGEDDLDCRDAPRGLLILRVLLPRSEVELPEVRSVPRRQFSGGGSDGPEPR